MLRLGVSDSLFSLLSKLWLDVRLFWRKFKTAGLSTCRGWFYYNCHDSGMLHSVCSIHALNACSDFTTALTADLIALARSELSICNLKRAEGRKQPCAFQSEEHDVTKYPFKTSSSGSIIMYSPAMQQSAAEVHPD